MSEYLSKEEVKHWRSSLEKITLEEYASRLGKVIEEEKHTNDIVDIVLKGQPVMSKIDDLSAVKNEKINAIAQKAFEREKEITQSEFFHADSKNALSKKNSVSKYEKPIDNFSIIFNKPLTDREQAVFDYLAQNRNQIVYAKDLAKLLDLPRDYVYKYIKNLRAKIQGGELQNADNGGYVLNI